MSAARRKSDKPMRIRLRKGDTVKVTAGKDLGKTGKILRVLPDKGRLIVEGVNFVKKHAKRTRQDRAGGIHEVETTIDVSNVMLVCPKCRKTTRIGVKLLGDGTKARICLKCGEIVEH